MLYVTTRNHQDAFTSSHVLTSSRGADGGLFTPLHLPKLSEQDWKKLADMSFGQCTAELLNLFLATKLTGWDVDFSIGRYPVRIEPLPNRIVMAECWHNPDWRYKRLEQNLMDLVRSQMDLPGNWIGVVIRMAVLAGMILSQELLGMGKIDISVVSADFTAPISAWYLRKMGLPVGNIICCCNENNQLWDLICNGQMRTDAVGIATIVPEADMTLPVNLERLIFACGGALEVERYLNCCRTGQQYSVTDAMLQQLREGLYVSVASSTRVAATIPNVYKTHGYLLSPASALAYSGLMDYRTKAGSTRTAMLLCDQSPVCDATTVAKAMEIPVVQLKNLI